LKAIALGFAVSFGLRGGEVFRHLDSGFLTAEMLIAVWVNLVSGSKAEHCLH
jgi:hypothetical protein